MTSSFLPRPVLNLRAFPLAATTALISLTWLSPLTAADPVAVPGMLPGAVYTAAGGDGFVTQFSPRLLENGTTVGTATLNTGGVGQGNRALIWSPSEPAGRILTPLGSSSEISRLNTQGTGAGIYAKVSGTGTAAGNRVVRWDLTTGAATGLEALEENAAGQGAASVWAINESGIIIGTSRRYLPSGASAGDRAVRWDAGATIPVELGNLGTSATGTSASAAMAINDAGTIAGASTLYGGVDGTTNLGSRAVRWDAGSATPVPLGILNTNPAGSATSAVADINSAGDIGGTAVRFSDTGTNLGTRAVAWKAGTAGVIELGNLGATATGVVTSAVTAISDLGNLTGTAAKYIQGTSYGTTAVRWDLGTTGSSAAIELEPLSATSTGIVRSAVFALNDLDWVAGSGRLYDAADTSLGDRAVLWSPQGDVYDLNAFLPVDSGWVLNSARQLTDSGWVGGVGQFDPDLDGPTQPYQRAFSWQLNLAVIPEPGSSFLTLGALLIPLMGRRRGRQA